MTNAELLELAELASHLANITDSDRIRSAALTVARSARARVPRGARAVSPWAYIDARDPEAQIQTGPSPRTPE